MDETLLETDNPMIPFPSSKVLCHRACVVMARYHIKDVRDQLCFQQEELHAARSEQTRKTEATHSPCVSLPDRKLVLNILAQNCVGQFLCRRASQVIASLHSHFRRFDDVVTDFADPVQLTSQRSQFGFADNPLGIILF